MEALSEDIFLRKMKIRCCVAYGPQENDRLEKKEAFWKYLDEEVFAARDSGAGFILQLDGNLWAGDKIISGDPTPQNRNGKLFEEFLQINKLTVVNSLTICEGLMKRRRYKDGKLEESIFRFLCCLFLCAALCQTHGNR